MPFASPRPRRDSISRCNRSRWAQGNANIIPLKVIANCQPVVGHTIRKLASLLTQIFDIVVGKAINEFKAGAAVAVTKVNHSAVMQQEELTIIFRQLIADFRLEGRELLLADRIERVRRSLIRWRISEILLILTRLIRGLPNGSRSRRRCFHPSKIRTSRQFTIFPCPHHHAATALRLGVVGRMPHGCRQGPFKSLMTFSSETPL